MLAPGNRLLEVVRVGQIPADEHPRRWLVERLWTEAAVGLIGGAPKSAKTWLGLDLALSVASGTACLGRYRVATAGPVLVYLAEDALSLVRERVAGMTRHRGLDLSGLEMHVITEPTLRLDREPHRGRLLETAKAIGPRLILLDPLVRLHRVDENHATEMAGLLAYFRQLQRQLQSAVILVHHTRKNAPTGAAAGQGLRGSSDLHAFGDSNLYLRRSGERLVLSGEHRAAPAEPPISLELVTTDPQQTHLEVRDQPAAQPGRDLAKHVLQLLADGTPRTRTALRGALSVNNQRLGEALKSLERTGHIRHTSAGWQRVD